MNACRPPRLPSPRSCSTLCRSAETSRPRSGSSGRRRQRRIAASPSGALSEIGVSPRRQREHDAEYANYWKARNGIAELRWAVSVRGLRVALFRREFDAILFARARFGEAATVKERWTRPDVRERWEQ